MFDEELYKQMHAACEQIGVKMLSDDMCCKLLAVVFVYGDESAVYSPLMRLDIKTARDRAHINPCCMSDVEMAIRIADYTRQLETGNAPWLSQIESRYGVIFPKLEDMSNGILESWKERINGVRIPES